MPDPLLGVSLQSFAPPVQPFAVSGAVALLSLDHPSVLSETSFDRRERKKRRVMSWTPHVERVSW
jgi:hypothetical protein